MASTASGGLTITVGVRSMRARNGTSPRQDLAGRALGPERTTQLLDILLRVETGAMRLKGLLPPGVAVRHKTGSLGLGVANDVGIIDLPDDAGRVVVAVFVKESTAGVAAQERAIAQIARAAYDDFTFNPGR